LLDLWARQQSVLLLRLCFSIGPRRVKVLITIACLGVYCSFSVVSVSPVSWFSTGFSGLPEFCTTGGESGHGREGKEGGYASHQSRSSGKQYRLCPFTAWPIDWCVSDYSICPRVVMQLVCCSHPSRLFSVRLQDKTKRWDRSVTLKAFFLQAVRMLARRGARAGSLAVL
jgi:hypothetical protein